MSNNDTARNGESSTDPVSLLQNHHRFNANYSVGKKDIYNASNGIDKRPAALVRRFGELYSVARLDTLDALDNIDELDLFNAPQESSSASASSKLSSSTEGSTRTKSTSEEFKNKLLFSVVVVSAILTETLIYPYIINSRIIIILNWNKTDNMN